MSENLQVPKFCAELRYISNQRQKKLMSIALSPSIPCQLQHFAAVEGIVCRWSHAVQLRSREKLATGNDKGN
jgi:hypothetical protein